MKPDTCEAMRHLIGEIKRNIPLELTEDDICKDDCRICSVKLLEYLASEIDSWEYRLKQNERPDFRDLSRLEKSGRKIYRALQKSGLIAAAEPAEDSRDGGEP